jgi:glycosyltransferase involved in cell wall biosynthesis
MELENPLVSILMPAYNCEKFVSEAIDCILIQTYENWELLVADDASTDKTRKIIDKYSDKRIKRFHNEINLGYLQTWNKLIQLAAGKYITFQDADDVSELNRIELLLETILNSSDISVVGSNYHRINSKNKIIYSSNLSLNHNDIVAKIPNQFDILGSGIMIRKEVYQSIGGYNEFFDRIGAEDYYWLLLIIKKFRVRNVPHHLYNYRENNNSLSGKLSSDFRKMISFEYVKIFSTELENEGIDSLSKNDLIKINEIKEMLEKPYLEDPSYLYQLLAKRYYNSGKKLLGIRMQLTNIIKKPNISKIRDLIYYIKKI